MNEKLTLQDIVDLLAKKAKISKKDSESFLRELFTVINNNILENEIVKVKDFGTFKPTLINSRESIDVNTGQKIQIPAHYRLIFTPDKALKELVNKPFASFESILLTEDSPLDSDIKSEAIVDEDDSENQTNNEITETMSETETEDEVKVKPEIVSKKEDSNESEQKEKLKEENNISHPKSETFTQPSFSYSYISDNKEENSEKIVFTIPIPEISTPSASVEPKLTDPEPEIEEKVHEEEQVVESPYEFDENTNNPEKDIIVENIDDDAIDIDQLPIYNQDDINIDSELIRDEYETPPPYSASSNLDEIIEETVVEEKTKKEKKETIYVEMPKTATPPLRIRKADLVKDNDIKTEEIFTEKGNPAYQSTEHIAPQEYKTESDNSEEDDPDFQDDYTYEDYYIRDKKTRNISRIILIILIAAISLGALIFLFSRLLRNPDKTANVPVYNAHSFVAADTLPILKQDSAAISQFQKGDSIKLLNQTNKQLQSDREDRSRDKELKGKKSVTLQLGETLMKLSAEYYGRKDYWVYIYVENKDRIGDPNNVSVGTYLVIPELSKYVANPDSQSAISEAKKLSDEILRSQY